MSDDPGIQPGEQAVRMLDHVQSLIGLDELRAIGKEEQAVSDQRLMDKGICKYIQVEITDPFPHQPEFLFFSNEECIRQYHHADDGDIVMMTVAVVGQPIKGPANGAAQDSPSAPARVSPAIKGDKQ